MNNVIAKQQADIESHAEEEEEVSAIFSYPDKLSGECFETSPLLFHSAVYARSIHNIVSGLANDTDRTS